MIAILKPYLAMKDSGVGLGSKKRIYITPSTADINPCIFYGAEGGTRTHTPVKTLDFESSASTSSATSAAISGCIK